MTFNLRFENDRDGDNAWVNRRELVLDIIDRYQPAILGTQEGKWTQLTYLCDHLQEYEAVMPGRAPDQNIQCPTLFCRKKDCTVETGKDFWLSKTPEIHLSKDWDSAYPRMLSFAVIRTIDSNQRLVCAVTHLDHIGAEARYQQARIISAWVSRQEKPVVLMGDFNDHPKSPVHEVLTIPQTRLCDTWEMIRGSESEASYTHHGFSGTPQLSRMDWILVDSSFQVKSACVVHDASNGRYPSDHFPYLAEILVL